MNISATVEKNSIRLPEGVHFPDGTRVIVASVDDPQDSRGNSFGRRMEKFVGIADDLPADLARNLDHYVHGQPKQP